MPAGFWAGVRRHRRAILAIALVCLWLAQAAAVVHMSRHVGTDSSGLPGQHTQLCTDCASMLPLLVVAGAAAVALVFGAPVTQSRLTYFASHSYRPAPLRAFQSRAPPR